MGACYLVTDGHDGSPHLLQAPHGLLDYVAGSDEFGSIAITGSPSKSYNIGDKLEVIVPHCDPVINEYDQMFGIRKDHVEVVWTIDARGKSQ